MTPESVAAASAAWIARLAMGLDRRGAPSVAELLPIVEALAAPWQSRS